VLIPKDIVGSFPLLQCRAVLCILTSDFWLLNSVPSLILKDIVGSFLEFLYLRSALPQPLVPST
jgi:hypothetical protein